MACGLEGRSGRKQCPFTFGGQGGFVSLCLKFPPVLKLPFLTSSLSFSLQLNCPGFYCTQLFSVFYCLPLNCFSAFYLFLLTLRLLILGFLLTFFLLHFINELIEFLFSTLTPMNLIYSCYLLSFCLCFLSLTVLLVSSASESELKSLLEFKKGIQTDPLDKVLGTWHLASVTDPYACPLSWTGVFCDRNGNVSAIVLDSLGLGGELKFSTLTGLTLLQNLSLSGNHFSGRLVPALGTMTSLQHLDLSRNRFYGPIPQRINDLWGLNYLNFSSNNFTGEFPVGRLNLNQLRVLDLHLNGLWGDIGKLISQLRNVDFVDLSYNEFSRGLSIGPENSSSLANTVSFLNLSHNRLDGGFFDGESIVLFRNLQVLDLGDNQIVGQLPSFGSLPNLRVMKLGNNQLSGSIPEELLSSRMKLEVLDLNGNSLTGSVSEINSTTLNVLNISSNGLSGSLPSVLRSCMVVDLSRNMISGNVSIMHSWEATLKVLDLSSNKLSGSFPSFTSQLQGLTVLNFRNNSLVGSLPSDMGTYPSLSVVDLSLNFFSGLIPPSFFTLVNLTSLSLSDNNFTGPLPLRGSGASELLVKPSDMQLEHLDLSYNSLTGELPYELGDLVGLQYLNLASNEFSGTIPDQLTTISNLEYLDLSGNKFTGQIPDNLPSSLHFFNVSYNFLSGSIPENLRRFPITSFHPGNDRLIIPDGLPSTPSVSYHNPDSGRHNTSKGNTKVAIIAASIGAAVMIIFILIAYRKAHSKEFQGIRGLTGQNAVAGRDVKVGRLGGSSLFRFRTNVQSPSTSFNLSDDRLLTSYPRSLSGLAEFPSEISENVLPGGGATTSASINLKVQEPEDNRPATFGSNPSLGAPSVSSSSPQFIEASEKPVMLNVYSPDRLAGELLFLDSSLSFTAEELSRAPAEVLGRSSHGTLYKATLDSGHMLSVKWLRVGLVKHKKEFAKEVRKIGSIRHPNVVPLRAYYWGPREQERLLLADYIHGDSLALHLYESTPRRYSPLSFSQRLKVGVDVCRCLLWLHDRGLPHGNLKPTNIILSSHDYDVHLTDYGLHRLMTPAGIAEQILNMGALGYRAPELSSAAKPLPTVKADVYAFGVILMELLTRRSAGDIISGQSGAVDLTDWVRLCDEGGRMMDCIDRDIASGEEPPKAMEDLLAVSIKCILPVNERPNIRQALEELSSISV